MLDAPSSPSRGKSGYAELAGRRLFAVLQKAFVVSFFEVAFVEILFKIIVEIIVKIVFVEIVDFFERLGW